MTILKYRIAASCEEPTEEGRRNMERDNIWYLKNFNIFEGMSEDEMNNLSKMINTDWIKRRERVYLQGDSNRYIYFLKQGLVKLSLNTENGKTVTIALLKPGEVFGELSFDEQPESSTEAVAMKDCYLCRMSRQQFMELAKERQHVMFSVNKLLGLRMRKVESAIQDLLFLDVPARLAKLLIQVAESDGEETPDGTRLTLKLTHQELANLVGATREMVSIVMGRFADEGLTFQKKRFIIIPDRKRLTKLYS